MSDEKVRVTMHSGRVARVSKHNDRKFDTSKSEHINESKSKDNIYWQWDKGQSIGEAIGSFENSEKAFYEEHFGPGLAARNERYKKEGHSERCKTMDQYRMSYGGRPDENIWMIGNKNVTVHPYVLWDIVGKELEWKIKTFKQIEILDVALHMDEEGGPHIHERFVWIGHDKFGYEVVGQKKALDEMSIERPNIVEPENKVNNSKTTYTKMCREHFIETCKSYGLDIEEIPKEPSKTGLSLIKYQYREIESQLENAKIEHTTLQAENKQLIEENKKYKDMIEVEHEELEKTMIQKVDASKIKHIFGDKEVRTYRKSSIDQAENIAHRARKDREEAEQLHYLTISEKRKAEKLKEEYEMGVALKAEYEKKVAHMDALIKSEADRKFELFASSNSQPDIFDDMRRFMKKYQSTNGRGSLLDDFYSERREKMEELEKEYIEYRDYDFDEER